jgi:hypothetical protein
MGTLVGTNEFEAVTESEPGAYGRKFFAGNAGPADKSEVDCPSNLVFPLAVSSTLGDPSRRE